MEMTIAKYLWSFAGLITLPALLFGSVMLHRRRKVAPTLFLACSLAAAWIGQLIQIFAPFEHTTAYITDAAGNVTGATGTFPTLWYLGSILASLSIVSAVISFIWFAIMENRS